MGDGGKGEALRDIGKERPFDYGNLQLGGSMIMHELARVESVEESVEGRCQMATQRDPQLHPRGQ